MKLKAILFSILVVGCTATVDTARTDFYDDSPAEPELSSADAAMLPQDLDAVHVDELTAELAAEPAETDAAVYDDDETEQFVDVEGTADDDAQLAQLAGLPAGEDDDLHTAGDPQLDATYYAAILKWGLHPRASDGLRAAGVSASRIMQTIGNAAASAGTHAQDGTFQGHAYSAATDISVSGLSSTQIANLLEKLAKVGFAAWYRHTGHDGWSGVNHIHAVYANCLMKSSLRSQVRSWLAGRNGLVSNSIYSFHHFSSAAKAAVHGKWEMSHEGTSNSAGGGVSGRVNTSGISLHVRSGASLTSSIVGSVADGSYVTIKCQKRGGSVTGTYGTTTLWDKIGAGYVSDAYVATGSDHQIAPNCP